MDMESQQDESGQAEQFSSERAPDFDAAREAYEAALAEYFDLIDKPRTYVPGGEYRRELEVALGKQQRTHKAMMAVWV